MTYYYCTRCDSEHCPKTQNADEPLVKDRPAVNEAQAHDCLQGLNMDAQEFVDFYKEAL